MTLWPDHDIAKLVEDSAARDENRTLQAVIRLVSSPLERAGMLQRVVDIATEATGCHACFIYLLERDELVIRAASPVFQEAVDRVRFSVNEGLAGWVARNRAPEFIRDQAMRDPRMKYVPELREEEFQSMAAVPILSRAGETIGVIVLHTEAPREFEEDTLKLLVHIASLVSGAIENAQLYDRERRRVTTLTGLAELGQQVASATNVDELAPLLVARIARLLDAPVCQLLRTGGDGEELSVLASVPDHLRRAAVRGTVELSLIASARGHGGPTSPWPEIELSDLLAVPLSAGEDVGLLLAGATDGRTFDEQDAELARAIAHLAAMAIKRVELIEGLTKSNAVKDLFEALAAGALPLATAKAAELRCELTSAYLMVCAEPAGSGAISSATWRTAAEQLGQAFAHLTTRSAVEAGPGPVRGLLVVGASREARTEELLGRLRELGQQHGAVIGVSEWRRSPADACTAHREARDAATIGRALLGDGGAIDYSRVGAYRYLVHIGAGDAPRDRMRSAVDRLLEYDARRRTSLLDTLERYLSMRCSVTDCARDLYVHPNTLRQRLGRIEDISGVDLGRDDLLSLELAIKLARLHGRSAQTAAE
jgi:GAF domain-containing protein